MRLIRALKFLLRVSYLGAHSILMPRRLNWYESSAHRLLEVLGSVTHARQHRRLFRHAYVEVAALRKFRELVHGRDFLAEARVSDAPKGSTLVEGLQRWHVNKFKALGLRVGYNPLHTTIFLKATDARPLEMFATLLSSGQHNNISFVWNDTDVPFTYRARHSYGLEESKTNTESDFDTAYDLATVVPEDQILVESIGAPPARNGIQADGWRRANDLIKATAPGSTIVAVSFPEDELGFCDEAIAKMLPTFEVLHKCYPWVLFCLVSRTTLDARAPLRLASAGILPVRSRGLNYLATLALIERSAFFVGALGEFANTAIGHRKKGLYIGPAKGDMHDDALKQWFLVEPTQQTLTDIISSLVELVSSDWQIRTNAHLEGTSQTFASPQDVENIAKLPVRSKTASDASILEKTAGWEERVRTSKWFVPVDKRRTVTVYIDVFGYCNLRCPSCPVGNWPKDEEKAHTAGMIEEKTLRSIIEKAMAESTVSSVGLFNWTEPLLNPNVNHLVRVVRSYGLSCSISSNLNILKDPEGLLEAGLDWLRISLSGFTQEIYGHYHKKGNIDRVMENMRRLAKARDATGATTDIEVFFHKYVDNGDDEVKMKTYAKELGFRFVAAWAYLMPVEKMLAIAAPDDKNASQLTNQDHQLIDRLALSPEEALKVTRQKKSGKCELYDFLTIDIRGNLFLCCAASGRPQNRIANYLEEGLPDIYRKQRRHAMCGSCLKHGLPELYGHSHHEFLDIGTNGRDRWKAAQENNVAESASNATPR